MTAEKRVKAKVFLEGVEIPFFDVTVQTAIGGSTTAEIGIPPAEAFFELTKEDPKNPGVFVRQRGILPRTMVHVFYLDDVTEPNEYRLLFEGEYLGYRYEKTPSSRQIKMVASDFTNIFNIVYTRYFAEFFLPYDKLLSAFAGVNRDGQRMSISLTGTDPITDEIMRIIRDEDASRGRGIAYAIKRIIAESVKKNDFFKFYQERTKVSDKVFSLDDPDSVKLLSAEVLKPLLMQNMSNLKESNSLWDILNQIMSIVFYYPVTVPTAPYVKAPMTTSTTFTVDGSPKTVTSNLLDSGIKGDNRTVEESLVSTILKPYTFFSAPPTCNVIFPDQYTTFSFARRFDQEPTRLVLSAFSLIEEALGGTQLGRILPKKFIYLAPTPLIAKIDQEAEFTTSVSGSVIEAESKVESKKAEIAALERERQSLVNSGNNSQAAVKASQISTAKTDLDNLSTTAATLKAEREAQFKASGRSSTLDGVPAATQSVIGQKLFGKNILTSFDGVDDASREDLKGIVQKFDQLSNTQATVAKSSNVNLADTQVYLSNLANYKLYLAQHEPRQMQMTMVFSPQLIAGFPALVVDPVENMFGELDVIVHSISAEGNATTTVQLSLARSDEAKFSEIDRSKQGSISFPNWINTKYLPSSIGDDVYKVLFPANGKIPALKSILVNSSPIRNTQYGAASEIRKQYQRAVDKGRFINGFTRRNIATISQVFSVLGGVPVNEGLYSISSSIDERLKEVFRYRQQVQNKVFSFTSDFASV